MSDELGFNKIAGAILATALAFIGIKELAHAAYHPHMPEVPAYGADILAAAEAAANKGAEPVIELPFPQATWIAAMDADKGAAQAKKMLVMPYIHERWQKRHRPEPIWHYWHGCRTA